MKINLLFLIDVFEDITGGAERQVFELLRGIDKKRFNVQLCILHQDYVPEEIKELGICVQALGVKRIYGLDGIRKGREFLCFIEEEKIDILMAYHFSSDIWGAYWGRKANLRIISNRRDEGFWRKWFHILAYRLTNRWVDKICVVSGAVKRKVITEEGVSPQKVSLLYSGVDLNRFETKFDSSGLKRELGLTDSATIIGCVGNLKPVKGHKFLIEAAKEILATFPDVHFIVVGEDEFEIKGALEQEIKRCNVNSNVHLLGRRIDIPQLLQIMDICVLPSLSEGLSNTLLEYMAMGKPIVATNVGGNPELITHMEQGLLVPPADSHALAEAIVTLAKNRELADKLGRAARLKIEQSFSIEKMIKEYENTFEDLTNKNKICHLISSNGLYGAEKVMFNLANEINMDGYKVWVAGFRNAHNPHVEVIEEATKQGISTFTIDSHGRVDLRTVSKLARFIKENNISLLHTHNYKSDLIGLLAAKRTGIPVVATVHGYIDSDRKSRFYETLDRFILRYFNKVVLVDKSLQRWFPCKNGKYTIINNGVGSIEIASSFAYGETPRNDRLSSITIGTVGRLSEEKGHKYLIEAFEKLSKEYPIARLLIVGEGTLHNELKNLSIKLNIADKVTFAGYQSDVSPYYRKMDIYVSSSLIEHFPVCILEAMAAGKAVIATNAGGTVDLIKDGETGLLVETNSADVIYTALLKLIDNTLLRDKLAVSAKRYVAQNYSLDKMIAQYQKVYAEVSRDRA